MSLSPITNRDETSGALGEKKASYSSSLILKLSGTSARVLTSKMSKRINIDPGVEEEDNGSSETLNKALAEVGDDSTCARKVSETLPKPSALGTFKGRLSRALHKTLTRNSTNRHGHHELEKPSQDDAEKGRAHSQSTRMTQDSDRFLSTDQHSLDAPHDAVELRRQVSVNTVITLNIGGRVFSTTWGTITQFPDSLLAKMLTEGTNRVIDVDGQYFVDRDGKHFGTILNFMRSGACTFPEVGSLEWEEMANEVTYYNLKDLQTEMQKLELESFARAQRLEFLKQKLHGDEELIMTTQAKEIEKMRVELQRLLFENRKFSVLAKHKSSKVYAYNLLVVGVTGTGKSSSLNTLLDSPDNIVSGAQAQGTRGTTMRDGIIDDRHFISYIDTQGLGADTSVSDKTLLTHIMTSTESIIQMKIINNILISFDLSARATPATMANQLTLIELFSELRESAFLCFTKWNTNSVLSEWNHSLRKWVRRWRRSRSMEEIDEDPPSYEQMYREYSTYLLENLATNADDAGAFAKMSIVLAFFEARVVWMFNLDEMEQLDKEEDELAPHIERMYNFYRQQALQTLQDGSTVIDVSDLVFLKSSEDSMMDVATRLVESRDNRIELLNRVASNEENFASFKEMFGAMTRSFASKVASRSYSPTEQYLANIARLTGRSQVLEEDPAGKDVCTIS